MEGIVYEPTEDEMEQERAYWAHQDRREEWAEEEIKRLQERVAELEEWVEEIAGDLLERTEGAA